jgi:hypothetical protein
MTRVRVRARANHLTRHHGRAPGRDRGGHGRQPPPLATGAAAVLVAPETKPHLEPCQRGKQGGKSAARSKCSTAGKASRARSWAFQPRIGATPPGCRRGSTPHAPRLPPPTAAADDDGNGSGRAGDGRSGGPGVSGLMGLLPGLLPGPQAWPPNAPCTLLVASPVGRQTVVEMRPPTPTLPRNDRVPLQALSLDAAVGGGSRTAACPPLHARAWRRSGETAAALLRGCRTGHDRYHGTPEAPPWCARALGRGLRTRPGPRSARPGGGSWTGRRSTWTRTWWSRTWPGGRGNGGPRAGTSRSSRSAGLGV